jgi:hypothetical protein
MGSAEISWLKLALQLANLVILTEDSMAYISDNNNSNYVPGTPSWDDIYGNGGNDTIVGGQGADWLWGGSGADHFKYNSSSETTGDVIKDYKWSENDKIDVHNIDAKESVWWNPSTWGNQDFTYMGNVTNKALYAGQLGYAHAGGNTYVYGNTDNDGTYEVAIKVDGYVSFIKSDFIL